MENLLLRNNKRNAPETLLSLPACFCCCGNLKLTNFAFAVSVKMFRIPSAECYNVLSPFFEHFSVIYRWNCNQVFCNIVYLDCVSIFKAFNFDNSRKSAKMFYLHFDQ